MSNPSTLSRWLLLGEWHHHPVRVIVAIAAIALGVALGFAIHLINGAAFNEFSAANKSVTGLSDLQVRSAQSWFNEALYPRLAQHDKVALASPVLSLDAEVIGQASPLKILGIDVFRAAAITPALMPLANASASAGQASSMFADDAIFLSIAAMEWLKVKEGDALKLRSGSDVITLRVAGGLAHSRVGQRIAVMDIGAAQWRFKHVGLLSYIDLKLVPGVSRSTFKTHLQNELNNGASESESKPEHILITESQDQEVRTDNMSRAYRVNLNVLALVALFTGAFLVFSTQALSVIRRRQQLALLRVIGVSRRHLLMHILSEGAMLGMFGALLGLAGGYAIAALALRFFGGDLGAGYFPGIQPTVQFDPLAACLFFILGTGVAVFGSVVPAWDAAKAQPAHALKSGSEDIALSRLSIPWPGIVCLIAALVFSQCPPIAALPVFGFLSIACLLIGGIALTPRLTAMIFGRLDHHWGQNNKAKNPIVTLTLARLANAPNQASIALGGVLASFSLMVAMAIMVTSFRVSVDDWMITLLPADIYITTAVNGNTSTLSPAQQRNISQITGIARAEFMRITPLTLNAQRPNVALIARVIDRDDPSKTLPLVAMRNSAMNSLINAHSKPIWVSEAMVDLYGYTLGKKVRLPLHGANVDFIVIGIVRDYARQAGAIYMHLSDYQTITGDLSMNDAGIWLAPNIATTPVMAQLKHLTFSDALKFSETDAIRAMSLKVFDRTFALTYALEIVAVLLGLFGVAATFSAQTLARAKEFGMLRHLGTTRRQILLILAAEGGLITSIGIAIGLLLGWLISLVLVFIVNPQSFHWTMELHIPWSLLITAAFLLLTSATLTALIAGRYAVSGDAIRAVKEDW